MKKRENDPGHVSTPYHCHQDDPYLLAQVNSGEAEHYQENKIRNL